MGTTGPQVVSNRKVPIAMSQLNNDNAAAFTRQPKHSTPAFAGSKNNGLTPRKLASTVALGVLGATAGLSGAAARPLSGNMAPAPANQNSLGDSFTPSVAPLPTLTKADRTSMTNLFGPESPAQSTPIIHDLSELSQPNPPASAPGDMARTATERKTKKNKAPVDPKSLIRINPSPILKRPAFNPTDDALFKLPTNSQADAIAQVANLPAPTDDQLKSQLSAILTKRLRNPKAAAAVVALMDDPKLKAVIPNSNLRAALLNAKGLASEGTIDAVRNGAVDIMDFATGFRSPQSTALTGMIAATGQKAVLVNEVYKNAPFEQLTALISAHEVPAHGPSDGDSTDEEISGYLAQATVWGQQLLENPALANPTFPGALTPDNNLKLLARVNSRHADGSLSILSSNSPRIMPQRYDLNNNLTAFKDLVPPNEVNPDANGVVQQESPGNSLMNQLLSKITGLPVAKLANANFDSNTINLLDQNQKLFSSQDIIKLANALKLNLSAGIPA